jgi:hypothetical protein
VSESEIQNLAEVMDKAIANSIWRPPSTAQEPHVELSHWAIMKVKSKAYNDETTYHFVGRPSTSSEGRASSKIVSFDPVTRQGTTASGRVYGLIGDSGVTMNAAYVWGNYARINEVYESESIDETGLDKIVI